MGIFLLLTGTLLLVQPPMMGALSLRLTEDRRNHHEDLLQCFHALSETPVSQYMLETMLRGLHGDVLKHAIGAAVLSTSLVTIMPVYNYRTAFLDATILGQKRRVGAPISWRQCDGFDSWDLSTNAHGQVVTHLEFCLRLSRWRKLYTIRAESITREDLVRLYAVF